MIKKTRKTMKAVDTEFENGYHKDDVKGHGKGMIPREREVHYG